MARETLTVLELIADQLAADIANLRRKRMSRTLGYWVAHNDPRVRADRAQLAERYRDQLASSVDGPRLECQNVVSASTHR